MQAPPLFTSMQRMRRIQNKYCKNANNNKMPQWTKEQLQEAIQKVKANQLSITREHGCLALLFQTYSYVLEHICFSSLWLESTQVIVYANVGMRTTGIFLFCWLFRITWIT